MLKATCRPQSGRQGGEVGAGNFGRLDNRWLDAIADFGALPRLSLSQEIDAETMRDAKDPGAKSAGLVELVDQ